MCTLASTWMCAFLNLMAAYDQVSRPVLLQILKHLGVHSSMWQATTCPYDMSIVAFRISERCEEPLEPVFGVRQGCPLSPPLNRIFAEGLRHLSIHLQPVAAADADGLAVGPDTSLTDLGYADDFCLVSAAPDGLLRLINPAALWCEGVGMLASLDNTVVLMEVKGNSAPKWSQTCGG